MRKSLRERSFERVKFGIDIDGVLADFMPVFRVFVEREYGDRFELEDVRKYDLTGVLGTREETWKKVMDFIASKEFADLPVVRGARECVQELANSGAELFVVTSRPSEARDTTLEWLEQNFPRLFKGVYFSWRASDAPSPEAKKLVCERVGIGVLFDDRLDVARECSKVARAYLMDQPWNRLYGAAARWGAKANNMKRVNSWYEFISELAKEADEI